MSDAERRLVMAALRWARTHGWTRSRWVWVSPHRPVPTYLAFAGQPGSRELHIIRACAPVIAVADVAEAVSILAVLGLLPARFCTLGRQALLDHAAVLHRFAEHLLSPEHDTAQRTNRAFAAGLDRAAASAVTMARSCTSW